LTLLWAKDDKPISDCHVYFDVAVVKAQLGAGPKALTGLPAPRLPTGETEVFDPTPQQGDNAAVVKTALDALESTNERAYLAYFTDDVEVNTLEHAAPVRGRDQAVKAYFKAMHKALGQLETTVANAWPVSQFAIVEYAIAGEQLGSIGWVPLQLSPQKEPHVVRLQVADVAEIRDGKIARVWRYDNPAQIALPGP
jgi:ketosteroid isomerase-like protein